MMEAQRLRDMEDDWRRPIEQTTLNNRSWRTMPIGGILFGMFEPLISHFDFCVVPKHLYLENDLF